MCSFSGIIGTHRLHSKCFSCSAPWILDVFPYGADRRWKANEFAECYQKRASHRIALLCVCAACKMDDGLYPSIDISLLQSMVSSSFIYSRSRYSYYANKRACKGLISSGHLWSRWIKLCCWKVKLAQISLSIFFPFTEKKVKASHWKTVLWRSSLVFYPRTEGVKGRDQQQPPSVPFIYPSI